MLLTPPPTRPLRLWIRWETSLAIAGGFTQIQLQVGAKMATSQVWVAATPAIPHFSGSGQMLTSYNPQTSLFVVAPFFLDADLLNGNSTFTNQVRQAGVNSLTFGLYVNPWNINTAFSDWQSNYDSMVTPKINWAQQNGFHLLLTGDDIFRRIGGDAWYTLNWPSGTQAVQYAVNTMAASGVGIGIEGIDEASSIWGPRPVLRTALSDRNLIYSTKSIARMVCVLWIGPIIRYRMDGLLRCRTLRTRPSPPHPAHSLRLPTPAAAGSSFKLPARLPDRLRQRRAPRSNTFGSRGTIALTPLPATRKSRTTLWRKCGAG